MPHGKRHILVLGGTNEALRLVSALRRQYGGAVQVTTSIAGRTRAPAPIESAVRVGGFGGAEGLLNWMISAEVDLVIDATHPFAANISASAQLACDRAHIPRLIITRRPWKREPGDNWHLVPDIAHAAEIVPNFGARIFLTIGSQGLAAFSGHPGIRFVVRMIDAPAEPLPLNDYEVVLGRGPFDTESEIRLMTGAHIDALVSRNSGGDATVAKITAARNLGLPVVMITPPPLQTGCCVHALVEALQWIEERMK